MYIIIDIYKTKQITEKQELFIIIIMHDILQSI